MSSGPTAGRRRRRVPTVDSSGTINGSRPDRRPAMPLHDHVAPRRRRSRGAAPIRAVRRPRLGSAPAAARRQRWRPPPPTSRTCRFLSRHSLGSAAELRADSGENMVVLGSRARPGKPGPGAPGQPRPVQHARGDRRPHGDHQRTGLRGVSRRLDRHQVLLALDVWRERILHHHRAACRRPDRQRAPRIRAQTRQLMSGPRSAMLVDDHPAVDACPSRGSGLGTTRIRRPGGSAGQAAGRKA